MSSNLIYTDLNKNLLSFKYIIKKKSNKLVYSNK